jgi:Tol biopolymer transport system component
VKPINATIPSPLQPSVSPDGRTIAFVTGEKVWLIDRDGRNLRQLFPNGYSQQRPAFSPDGASIAIVIANHLGIDFTGEIYVIDLDANDPTPLRTKTGAELMPDDTSRLNWVR